MARGARGRGRKTYKNIVLYMAFQAAPVEELWRTSQEISGFEPCNDDDKPCVYSRVWRKHVPGTSITLPTAKNVMLTNGGDYRDALKSGNHSSPVEKMMQRKLPLTRGNLTKEEITRKCHAKEMSSPQKVVNLNKGTPSSYFFLGFMASKILLDGLHDILLLCGFEQSAIGVSLASWLALGGACVACVALSCGLSELFISYNDEFGFFCFYKLPDLHALFAFAAPIGLFIHFLTRFENLLRAITFGDYLFSWSQNIPYQLIQANVRGCGLTEAADSMLLGTIVGIGPSGIEAETEEAMAWTYFKEVPEIPLARSMTRKFWSVFSALVLLVAMYMVYWDPGDGLWESETGNPGEFLAVAFVDVLAACRLTIAWLALLLPCACALTREAATLSMMLWFSICAAYCWSVFGIPVALRGFTYASHIVGLPLTPLSLWLAYSGYMMVGFNALSFYIIYIPYNFVTSEVTQGRRGVAFRDDTCCGRAFCQMPSDDEHRTLVSPVEE